MPTTKILKRPGPLPRTEKEEILKVALAQIEKDGADSLSMRKLAKDMKLGVMTLYNYFSTKDELLDGVCSLALRDIVVDLDLKAPWDKQLFTAIHDLYNALCRYPGVVDIFISRSMDGPTLDAIRDALLGILFRAGLSKRNAARYLGVLVSYAVGFAVLSRRRSQQTVTKLADRLKGLKQAQFPHLASAELDYEEHISNTTFSYGLQHLIAAVQSDTAKRSAAHGRSVRAQ